MGNSETPLSRSLSSLIIIAFFAGLFWMLFNEAMVRGVGHDEHQFIASGKLLAENGLLPYRDYPYFHMPYLVIVNALVSRITSYSFLGARAVSVLSALLTLGLIFSLAYRQFSNWSAFWRLAVSISSVVILAANPLFTYTSGQAWNHDFSTFLTLSGFLIFLQATQPGRGPGRLIISGVLLGLAAGVRLTYLVTGLPLVLALIFSPRLAEARDKLHSIGWFAMGWALALLPALFLFMLAPTQFLFGNLGYPQLNTLYRLETGFTERMSLVGKFEYLFTRVLVDPGNGMLFLGLLIFGIGALLVLYRTGRKIQGGLGIGFLLAISLFVAALIPTPAWPQYFYAPLPFFVLTMIYGVSALPVRRKQKTVLLSAYLLLAGLSVITGWSQYPAWNRLLDISRWSSVRVHAIGLQIGGLAKPGKILTLSPIYPVEGDLPIYPEFATGPFAWRTGHLLTPDRRAAYGMVTQTELEVLLAQEPPAGVLVGVEGDLEEPLVDYARAHEYRSTQLADGLTLWLPAQ